MKQVYVLQKNTQYVDGTRVTVTNRTCRICGGHFVYDRKRVGLYQPDNRSCPSCQFWYDRWLTRDDPKMVRVDGIHYMLLDFSGRSACLEFPDGRIVYTNNLWRQGRIPAVWIGLGLTDNARFKGKK